MTFTLSQIEALKKEGKIRGYVIKSEKKKVKRAKYGNNKVEWGGMVFDSKREYLRYRELLLLLKAGKIGLLQRQVKFDLGVCKYIADHVYVDAATGERTVEDVKSEVTRKLPVYCLKKKLMKEKLNIEIKEY